ncbi:hypothetical protein IQ06DRAFT_312880 [Phaeosphaeriaceae sp. SRC1lsM3a]|nr:hypothetical protein IQ06DRAFT_312880 [Stagonospora sp. SRC1lsM3a]
MSPTSNLTLIPASKLRSYLKDTLDDLPNTLPEYDEAQLLGARPSLPVIALSPLFLYAISPRLVSPPIVPDACLPPTPKSILSSTYTTDPDSVCDLTRLEIRIRWTDNSWAVQLTYNHSVLLEGRQKGVEQEVGFAGFLAWEFKAREGVVAERHDLDVAKGAWATGRARSLKLKIRLRDSKRGRAGAWRVE